MSKLLTKNVGRKFEPDGSYKFFPGNTIICKVKPECPFFEVANAVSKRLQCCAAASDYQFLPLDSFHITMIQGVCDVDRTPELWSSHLKLDVPLAEADVFFAKQFAMAPPFPQINMTFDYVDTSGNIIIIRLKPSSPEDRKRLAEYRNQIAALLGIRFPDHETYGFHLSIAYQIWQSTDEDATELLQVAQELNKTYQQLSTSFVVPRPVLTFFDCMEHFDETMIWR